MDLKFLKAVTKITILISLWLLIQSKILIQKMVAYKVS